MSAHILRTALAGAALAVGLAAAPGAYAACEFEPAERTRDRVDRRAAERAIENIMNDADQALALGNYGDACVKYALVLSIDPDNVPARIGLGEGALGNASFELARSHFEAVAALQPDNAAAQQGLGLAHFVSGDARVAEAYLRRAADADPALWRAWNALGVIADSRSDWSAADAAWAAALAAAPNEPRVLNNQGMSLMQRGESQASVAVFEQALSLDPSFATAAQNRRIALAMTGAYDEALVGVSESDRPSVLNNIAVVAARRGDRAVAERLLAAAVTAAPRYYEVAERNRAALRQAGR